MKSHMPEAHSGNAKSPLNETVKQTVDNSINSTIKLAKSAQSLMNQWSDADLDKVIKQIADTVHGKIDFFAKQEVTETGIGKASDKVHKLSAVTVTVRDNLLGLTTFGRIPNNAEPSSAHEKFMTHERVIEYAAPIGVIFAVVPLTNPIPNSLFKILHCIKTRNALILSYPRKATALGTNLVSLVNEILETFGIPSTLIQQTPPSSNRDTVQQFMSHPDIDLILATGGSALVNAAQRSGNPAYGVGPGNVPAWICADANLDKAAQDIIASKSYDNGIICGSENNLVVEQTIANRFMEALEHHGAAVLTPEEAERGIAVWFDPNTQKITSDYLGQPASYLAAKAKIMRSYSIKVLVIPTLKSQFELLGGEKLAPILSFFQCDGDEGLALCVEFLQHEGAGHTAVIHSDDPEKINLFAEQIPAGRILANTPATFGMMGVSTDLPLSFMVGSGSFGSNITTDNLGWRHFVNIKRLAPGTKTLADIGINNH